MYGALCSAFFKHQDIWKSKIRREAKLLTIKVLVNVLMHYEYEITRSYLRSLGFVLAFFKHTKD